MKTSSPVPPLRRRLAIAAQLVGDGIAGILTGLAMSIAGAMIAALTMMCTLGFLAYIGPMSRGGSLLLLNLLLFPLRLGLALLVPFGVGLHLVPRLSTLAPKPQQPARPAGRP